MARMPSIMQHDFSRAPQAHITRSSFDRSHALKTTFNSGYLVPIFWDEVIPGDTHNLRMSGFARLATPLHPFMDNLYFNTFFFFVPLRLLWTNFPRFMGEQLNPGDSTDFLVPQVDMSALGSNSLFDYLGLPQGAPGPIPFAAFLPRAYNLIWNEWFRDQNLQDRLVQNMGDGPDDPANYTLQRRGKRHDYFTSCLPWPQKGDAVDIPLGQSAPIRMAGAASATNYVGVLNDADQLVNIGFTGGDTSIHLTGTPNTGNPLEADLSNAIAPTINQLRQAFQLQKLLERDARGGTRYTELVRAHFNVVSPDARLQRPEYLGGGQSMVNLHTVPQTSAAGDYAATPQANLAAYGTASVNGHGFTQSFTEHGIILGLMSVRADLIYQQGLDRSWSRRTKYDFYWPALAFLGEQAVLSKEIFAEGTVDDDLVFGYQERWAEYRNKRSIVTGKFRSSDPQSLDTWHLAQDFATRPLLNEAFIVDDPPVERVIAVPSEPEFIFDAYYKLRSARPMPVYSVPGNIDRF
jgi:hypothetical protein